jgi:salicylate hydroxylase
MGERRPFVIVGAGLGGLTAAIAIAARGFAVRLVERSAELSEVGAGIQLAPNAGRVLAALGLDDPIAAAAIEPVAIDVVDGRTGGRLTSLGGATFRARYGFPYRVIHRADLQRVLADAAARKGIPIALGATVDGITAQSASVEATIRTPAASEVVNAEAIIAADGVWSSLRGTIPSAATPVPIGRTAWRAMIPAELAGEHVPTDRVGLWLGAGAHLVHYPVVGGRAVNVVAVVEGAPRDSGWSETGDPKSLTAAFASWSGRARNLVAAAPAWQTFPIVTLDPTRPWLAGRLVLLGDAAHAMAPFVAQGAAMAIEDAAVLADALAGGGNTTSALRAYVAARQPRVAAVARASRTAGHRFHLSGLRAAARNLALRVAGERLILWQGDAIYRWQPPERLKPR